MKTFMDAILACPPKYFASASQDEDQPNLRLYWALAYVQAAKNNPLGSMHQHQGSSSAGSTTGGWLEGKKALPVGGKLT